MQIPDPQGSSSEYAGVIAPVHAGFGVDGARMLRDIWLSLGNPVQALQQLSAVDMGELPSVYAVTDLAVASIGAAALSVAMLLARRHEGRPAVRVDRVLSSLWFARSIKPLGWTIPPAWDAMAGDYETRDGWIRLHTNAPMHRAAALRALDLAPDDSAITRAVVGAAVRQRDATALESAVVDQGGCAAQMRSAQAWAEHPQGMAVAAEPLLAIQEFDAGQSSPSWSLSRDSPLQGIRVLDLTRILAGPVATRFLAGYGANVLRIDPLDWEEPALAPEVTLGKQCARLDLRSAAGRARWNHLLAQADVLVHGYRADALEKLGLGDAHRRAINPALVEVCLDAYGWTGTWRTRRGFDSLVQMSSGIAEAGMRVTGSLRPTPLPVQALDHATGYIVAAAVLRGLMRRMDSGKGSLARASLARTAAMLTQHSTPGMRTSVKLRDERTDDYGADVERTPWGAALRLHAPCAMEGTDMRWPIAAGKLGDGAPSWRI